MCLLISISPHTIHFPPSHSPHSTPTLLIRPPHSRIKPPLITAPAPPHTFLDSFVTRLPPHSRRSHTDATHVVSPCLDIVGGRAEHVTCLGSGRCSEELAAKSGCKYAVQSCQIKIRGSDANATIWRSLFDTARQYKESFEVYGSKKSVEWPLVEGEAHVIHTAKKPEPEIPERLEAPDFAHLLPEPIRKFTQTIQDADHLSFVQGGGHGGSHPHLVNEMVSALRDGREPRPNAKTAANWTCVGICAAESCDNDGARVELPAFTLE